MRVAAELKSGFSRIHGSAYGFKGGGAVDKVGRTSGWGCCNVVCMQRTMSDSLLELHGVGAEADEQVNEGHLSEISRYSNCQWKSLHPSLEFPAETKEGVQQEIENLDAGDDEEGKRFALLSKWRDTKSSEATYRVLVGALLQAGFKGDAEMVCRLIQTMPQEPQPVSSSGMIIRSISSLSIVMFHSDA